MVKTKESISKLNALFSGYNLKKEHVPIVLRFTRSVGLVLLISYILASIISAVIMSFMMSSALKGYFPKPRLAAASSNLLNMTSSINHRELARRIVERNLFNSDGGEVPVEIDPVKSDGNSGVFDPNAPCQKSALKITLVGTIYLGATGPSLAMIKEDGIEDADSYRAGDLVIGSTTAKVFSVEQQRVVLNNNGVKECLELLPPAIYTQANSGAEILPGSSSGAGGVESGGDPGGCTTAVVDAGFVEKELGAGFANILTKGRLVPHNQDGAMKGFKLIGMDSNSLFGKICLKNGDVITSVNDISMSQPDQGFALYQAFESDRDIRISVLRGEAPVMISVRIK